MAPKFQEAGASRHGARGLRGARDAADLVHQLLAFARKAPLTPRPIELTASVQRMMPLLEAAAHGRRLRLDFDSVTPRILADRTQFDAALLCLVVNAREATESSGQIVVRVRKAELDGAPGISVIAEDDGEGMSNEVLTRATEPLFATKTSARHNGMGLSMVSGFVAQSRGRLDIRAAPGSGACVTMVFPATLTELA